MRQLPYATRQAHSTVCYISIICRQTEWHEAGRVYRGGDVGHEWGQVSVEEASGGDKWDGVGLLGRVDDGLDELVGGARLGDLLQEGQGLVVEDEVLTRQLSSKRLDDPAQAQSSCVSSTVYQSALLFPGINAQSQP